MKSALKNLKSFLLIILWLNQHINGQYLKQKYIDFNAQKCQLFSGSSIETVGCKSQGNIAYPTQSQTFLFVLYNPFNYAIKDTNLVINSQCTIAKQCLYAYNDPNKGSSFYKEIKSVSRQSEGGDYIYQQGDSIFVQGTYQSDVIQFTKNDEKIRMNFISVSQFDQSQYVADGVINLSRGNPNHIFAAGYQQEKLISPKFSFEQINSLTIRLNFNQELDYEDAPIIKTYSSDSWNIQIAGISLGSESVVAITHFQTINVNTVNNIYVPYTLAQYIQKKYPDYYSGDEYWQLNDCYLCQCLDDFPDVTIYTSEYAIPFKMRYLAYQNGMNCGFYISSTNFIFGLQQLFDLGIIFDPLNGSLQLTSNVQNMIHPSISRFYPIITLASISLFFLILLVTYFEFKLISISDEYEFLKKII